MKNEWTRMIIGTIMAITGFIGYCVAFKLVFEFETDFVAMAWLVTGSMLMTWIGFQLVESSTEEEDEEDYDYVVYVKEK